MLIPPSLNTLATDSRYRIYFLGSNNEFSGSFSIDHSKSGLIVIHPDADDEFRV